MLRFQGSMGCWYPCSSDDLSVNKNNFLPSRVGGTGALRIIVFLRIMKTHSYLFEKRTLTPQKAVAILAKHGTFVTPEEAKILLDFIYNFAKLSVKQVFGAENDEPSPKVRTPRKLFK